MSDTASLPPGPRMSPALQTLGWWTRPVAMVERARARYGKRFTLRFLATPPFVMLSDPDEVRQVFTAAPEVLHPGEGAVVLEPVIGSNSVILLDEDAHLEQRKLMLPAFHGEKMERLSGLMADVSEREAASWPRGEPLPLHPRLQALTLEVILRAVFGLDAGARLDRLRALLTEVLDLNSRPSSLLPFMRREFGGHSRYGRFIRLRAEADRLIYELIAERRAEHGDRDDVLSMLLDARHEDGSPMSEQELRDELMTLLVAGHETTASQLSWAFECLAREPAVVERLREEIVAGESEDYLTATIQEALRRRPVLPTAQPRLVKKPVEIGGWSYPAGVCLVANAHLIHHDPEIYPEPYAFRPERFLGEPPGTYTWIPFGGGRRRCLGASFAMLEMRIVLGAVLSSTEVRPGVEGAVLSRRRSITLSPRSGANTVLEQLPARAPAPVATAPAPAPAQR
jgi:cytochrome P450